MTATDPTETAAAGPGATDGVSRISQDGAAPVSEVVVSEVADALGKDEMRVEPLNDVVDPDALDALFDVRMNGERRDDGGRVQFRLDGCDVTVYGDGQVVVRR
jgi:hypothetical protein